jgi:protein-tyrosine-phosphatase
MKRVLFVCAQNVGRSQTAAALFNKYSPNSHADSAGTRVEKPGETISERAEYSDGAKNVIASLAEEGVDIVNSTRRQVTHESLDEYDKVIVMAEPESIPEWLSTHPKYEYWHIEDPRYKGLEETKKTQSLIKGKVIELIQQMSGMS